MRGWQKSDLKFGEELRIPSSLFIEGDRSAKRLLSVCYIGETASGIMVDCNFMQGIRTMHPENWHYRMMINWASIWCGHIKVYKKDGTMIRAHRTKGRTIPARVSNPRCV